MCLDLQASQILFLSGYVVKISPYYIDIIKEFGIILDFGNFWGILPSDQHPFYREVANSPLYLKTGPAHFDV